MSFPALNLDRYFDPPTVKPEEVAYCECGCKDDVIFYGDKVFENIKESSVNRKAYYCPSCIMEAAGLDKVSHTELVKIFPHIIKVLDFFDIKVVEAD